MRRRPSTTLLVVAMAAAVLAPAPPSAANVVFGGESTVSSVTGAAEEPLIVIDSHGTAVAVWLETQGMDAALTSSRPAGGAWSAPAPLSPGGTEVANLALSADQRGDVVVAWRTFPSVGSRRIQTRTRNAAGVWSSPVTASPASSGVGAPALAMNARGDTALAWPQYDSVDMISLVDARVRRHGHSWSAIKQVSASGHDTSALSVAVGADGTAAVAWLQLDGPTQRPLFVRTRSPSGSWGAASRRSPSDEVAATPTASFAADGSLIVVWLAYPAGLGVVRLGTRSPSGHWRKTTAVSPATEDGYTPTLALADDGGVLVAWTINGPPYTVRSRYRASNGTWKPPQDLSNGTGTTGSIELGMAGNGAAVAVWLQGTPFVVRTAVWTRGSDTWQSQPTVSSAGASVNELATAIDANGNTAVLWTRAQLASPGHPVVEARTGDLLGPIALVLRPSDVAQRTQGLTARWTARDLAGQVTHYDVRRRVTRWDQPTGAWKTFAPATTATSKTLHLGVGTTTCLDVRASNTLGITGPRSAPGCVTLPVDERSATASPGWRSVQGSTYTQHHARSTTTRGATLTLPRAVVRSLALLVDRSRKAGTITVSSGGKLLRTIHLKAHATKRSVLVPIKTWGSLKRRTVVVTVTSAHRSVSIDGFSVDR